MKNLAVLIVFVALSLGECFLPQPDMNCDCCSLNYPKSCDAYCKEMLPRMLCRKPCDKKICCGAEKTPPKFADCCRTEDCGPPPPPPNPCEGINIAKVCCGSGRPNHKCCHLVDVDCPQPSPKPDCYCTMQYDPVCCNGKTYGNACTAGCARAKHCVKGECGATDVCDKINKRKVCCENDYPGEYNKCCKGFRCPKPEPPKCTKWDYKFCCHSKGPRNPQCCAMVDCAPVNPRPCNRKKKWQCAMY
eukprot:TRINITY_DN29287_c0_g1_i1.p2 TRINITY_DN29287_c0_g1~~TRINITY_DN29287_c0_g1_i1.p2  ORF type:complete len:246 (-),score=18.49 TRINITY_DN29287_c0_g1_i1:210-947(-)